MSWSGDFVEQFAMSVFHDRTTRISGHNVYYNTCQCLNIVFLYSIGRFESMGFCFGRSCEVEQLEIGIVNKTKWW